MSKKIVFMGTPEFAVPSLKELKNSDYEILTVYSQPARKANRGQKLTKSEVEITAENPSEAADIFYSLSKEELLNKSKLSADIKKLKLTDVSFISKEGAI